MNKSLVMLIVLKAGMNVLLSQGYDIIPQGPRSILSGSPLCHLGTSTTLSFSSAFSFQNLKLPFSDLLLPTIVLCATCLSVPMSLPPATPFPLTAFRAPLIQHPEPCAVCCSSSPCAVFTNRRHVIFTELLGWPSRRAAPELLTLSEAFIKYKITAQIKAPPAQTDNAGVGGSLLTSYPISSSHATSIFLL